MKPELTIKNKKGQTAIDITKNKKIVQLFWEYLGGNLDVKAQSKEQMNDSLSIPKLNIMKVIVPKDKLSPKLTKKRNGSDGLLKAVM